MQARGLCTKEHNDLATSHSQGCCHCVQVLVELEHPPADTRTEPLPGTAYDSSQSHRRTQDLSWPNPRKISRRKRRKDNSQPALGNNGFVFK